MSTKHIVITGGVVSSLGKGITAAALGELLKKRGFNVLLQKFDPYLNVGTGMMSPYQHGEVYVTEDGAETDLDLGHYERFVGVDLTKNCSVSAGKVYWNVLNKERDGGYEGSTIQVIPHITNEIVQRIMKTSQLNPDLDIVITEIGGTVGDIESFPFLEAIRQLKYQVGKENVIYIHVTLVPYLNKAGELKTKPTQHSVKELRAIGIQPDIIICRTQKALDQDVKDKIALFCDLSADAVIENLDAESIYQLPRMMEDRGLAKMASELLYLEDKKTPDLSDWDEITNIVKKEKQKVDIGILGKYTELPDAYLSVVESLTHGAIANELDVKIHWLHSEEITEENVKEQMQNLDGIIAPSAFGSRGIEGIITGIKYAREEKIPFVGIGMGMQLAVVEFARNILGLTEANSVEIEPNTKSPVITGSTHEKNLDERNKNRPKMKLGAHKTILEPNTKIYEIYGKGEVNERHRHRYEYNLDYKEKLEEKGLITAGKSEEGFVDIIEYNDHPYFIGVIYHPEFKSRPVKPHPLFKEFIKQANHYKTGRIKWKQ